MQVRRPALAGLLALALVGCGDGVDTAVPGVSPLPGVDDGPRPDEEGRATFGFDVAFRTDDPREVVVRYGDSGSCPREEVDAEVLELASDVTVTLSALAGDGGPCTADYAPRDVTVRLAEPLDERALVDGQDLTEVQVADGPPPGPAGSPVPLPAR